MRQNPNTPIPDLIDKLERALGESHGSKLIRTDPVSRFLYSTDASIYQVEPIGVVFPRTKDDLCLIVELCKSYKTPMLARGSGSSLAGQAIGPAMIIDCTRFLNKIIDIDFEQQSVTVEPGVILSDLNRAVGVHGLQFGPDPASAERATLGGCIANNATGAHSIRYGMAVDHIIAIEVVLSDNSVVTFEMVDLNEANRLGDMANPNWRSEQSTRQSSLYRSVLKIRQEYAEIIKKNWPQTWRCASGYNLNYLLPWTATQPACWYERNISGSQYPPFPADHLNLSHIIAGSEGTLGIIRSARLNLVPLPRDTILGVLAYPGIAEACDHVPDLLESKPTAIELIPYSIIDLARSVPAYARQLSILDDLAPAGRDQDQASGAFLVVEYSADNPQDLEKKIRALGPKALIAREASVQKQIWAVRKVGLGIMMSKPGDRKPWAFIEDLSVPTENLGAFIREMERMFTSFGTTAEIYAHASAGCLHIRPILNLKTLQGVTMLRQIAEEAVNLTIHFGGAVSGEHGVGIARAEWLHRMFGDEIIQAFQLVKTAADPDDLFNPGKFIGVSADYTPPKMDHQLRFGSSYASHGWQTRLDFSGQGGVESAIEHCNGAGVCRKNDGVMCPSFQATQEEMHSTRGRSNLLRGLISGHFSDQHLGMKAVYEALDLCLACKGCKSECPSAVDMAKLKYEFTNYYYTSHHRRWRDYLFGYIGEIARLGNSVAPITNLILKHPMFSSLRKNILGIASQRTLPRFGKRPLHSIWSEFNTPGEYAENVLLLSDAFTEYFYPEVGVAAKKALQAVGCDVHLLPIIGAGRTLISKGFLEAAVKRAEAVLQAIEQYDLEGKLAVIGLEPSEIYTLRDEYPDLLPGNVRARRLAERAYMIDEFLVRLGDNGKPRILRIAERGGDYSPTSVLLHGHCYQKAQPPAGDGFPVGVPATVEMLNLSGYSVEVVQAGCCGMAGAFGYETEHYELSQKVGELGVFPAVRLSDIETILAACGVSCKEQIQDAANRKVVHPIELVIRSNG